MRRLRVLRGWKRFGTAFVLVAVGASFALMLGGGAGATDPNFGVGVSKGCVGVTAVGDPIRCVGFIQNQDRKSNTYSLVQLKDQRPATNPTSTLIIMQHSPEFATNVPNTVGLIFFAAHDGGGNVTCSPGQGVNDPPNTPSPSAGTAANPWVGATSCSLPAPSKPPPRLGWWS